MPASSQQASADHLAPRTGGAGDARRCPPGWREDHRPCSCLWQDDCWPPYSRTWSESVCSLDARSGLQIFLCRGDAEGVSLIELGRQGMFGCEQSFPWKGVLFVASYIGCAFRRPAKRNSGSFLTGKLCGSREGARHGCAAGCSSLISSSVSFSSVESQRGRQEGGLRKG
jgi:hypothetical protein